MEKVDQDYMNAIITSQADMNKEDESNNTMQDPMEVYEKLKEEAANLGTGDAALDSELILKFLQVYFGFYLKAYTKILHNIESFFL